MNGLEEGNVRLAVERGYLASDQVALAVERLETFRRESRLADMAEAVADVAGLSQAQTVALRCEAKARFFARTRIEPRPVETARPAGAPPRRTVPALRVLTSAVALAGIAAVTAGGPVRAPARGAVAFPDRGDQPGDVEDLAAAPAPPAGHPSMASPGPERALRPESPPRAAPTERPAAAQTVFWRSLGPVEDGAAVAAVAGDPATAPALESWCRALTASSEPIERVQGSRLRLALGGGDGDWLAAVAAEPDPRARAEMVRDVPRDAGGRPTESSIAWLLAWGSSDPSAEVRERALAMLPPELQAEAQATLARALTEDADPIVRARAAERLGVAQDPGAGAARALLAVAIRRGEAPFVRRLAAGALLQMRRRRPDVVARAGVDPSRIRELEIEFELDG